MRAVPLAMVLVSFATGLIAAAVEDRGWFWHSLGHSVSPWIALCLAVSRPVAVRPGLARCVVALSSAVLGYYAGALLIGDTSRAEPVVVCFWLVIAVGGGAGLGWLSATARGDGAAGVLATCTVVGALVGDVFNLRGGLTGLRNLGPSVAVSPDRPLDAASYIALATAIAYLCVRMRHWTWYATTLFIVPLGLLLGYILVSLPDLILFRGVW